MDNDSGFLGTEGKLNNIDSATSFPTTLAKDDFRHADFIHVMHNLYIVLTPLSTKV